MIDESKITFRKLQLEDLPLMYKWQNQPHVKEWYSRKEDTSFEGLSNRYLPRIKGEKPLYCYIVYYEDTPVGFMQTYLIDDVPDYAKNLKMDTAGLAAVDLFIGNEDFMGKGLGNKMLRKFMKEVTLRLDGVTKIMIGPEPDNIRAIKSYEKAGFKYLKTVHIANEGIDEYIMIVNKEEL
jgi:RimJ/RimL family protein N-acetyltransferase